MMSDPTPNPTEPVVHVVDDDHDLRQSLVFLLGSVGIETLTYPDAAAFLAEHDPAEPAVLVVDVRMPGLSGFQLQEELLRRDYPAPIIFCSAHGDIAMSVRALQRGAVDFLEKPYEPQQVLDVVQAQLQEAGRRFAEHASRRAVQERIGALTPREREVLKLIAESRSNRQIASELVISEKTVERHRENILDKLGMHDRVELTRYAIRTGLIEP
jgi:FixJ family two-component response regulator